MAIRSLLTRHQPLSFQEFHTNGVTKGIKVLRGILSSNLTASAFHDLTLSRENNDIDLKSKLLFLVHPRQSATSVLQNWVSEGRKVSIYDLRNISKQLVQHGRHKHALEVMKWMEAQERFQISETDHALRCNLMEKAEALQLHTLGKGGCPNYKTWEILMEGYIRNENMERAVFAMKNGFKMLKHCDWRPSPMIIDSVLKYFEKNGNLEDGKWFLKVLRDLNLASLRVYRSLIRMHVAKEKPFGEIVKLMEDDEIDMDDETMNLVQASQIGAFS